MEKNQVRKYDEWTGNRLTPTFWDKKMEKLGGETSKAEAIKEFGIGGHATLKAYVRARKYIRQGTFERGGPV